MKLLSGPEIERIEARAWMPTHMLCGNWSREIRKTFSVSPENCSTTFCASGDREPLTKLSAELVDDFTVTLAFDCHCLATPVMKPRRWCPKRPCLGLNAIHAVIFGRLNRAVNNHWNFMGQGASGDWLYEDRGIKSRAEPLRGLLSELCNSYE